MEMKFKTQALGTKLNNGGFGLLSGQKAAHSEYVLRLIQGIFVELTKESIRVSGHPICLITGKADGFITICTLASIYTEVEPPPPPSPFRPDVRQSHLPNHQARRN